MVVKRVASAIIFGIVLLGSLIWGRLPFTLVVAAVALIASVELFSMLETGGHATATVIGILGSITFVIMVHFEGVEPFGYIIFCLIVVSMVWYMAVLRHAAPSANLALTIFGSLYVGFLLSHIVLLRSLDLKKGWGIVLMVLILCWMYEIFAWMVGRKIGRHKLAPQISPGKSWEGTICGSLATLASAVAVVYIFRWAFDYGWLKLWVGLVLGLIVIIFNPLGDLSESLLKREYGVKDIGSIMPGHGGILDRFDGLLFVAPASFYFLLYFVLV